MSELGALYVSLGLDDSSFKTGINRLNSSMRNVQSEFKNATAGLSVYEAGLKGLNAKSEMLTKTINLQKQVVDKINTSYRQSKESLDISINKNAELKRKLEVTTNAYQASKKELGENAKATIQLKKEMDGLSAEVEKSDNILKNNIRSCENWETKLNNSNAKLKGLEAELQKTNKELAIQSNNFTKLGNKLEPIANGLKKVGKQASDTGAKMSIGLTAPIALFGKSAIQAAIDSESAFAGVRKTVDATEEEFKGLKKTFDNMSLDIPIDKNELYGVAEAAGQLGIKKDDISKFTETMSKLGKTTNLSANETSTSLARFANITNMNMKEVDKLGSVVVDLGNSLATTEQEIVEMGLRLAGAGKQVGMTEAQILSFAGALSSVGIEAEAGGTAFSRVMLDINTAVMSGSKKLGQFAKVSGVSAQEFTEQWKKDPAEAMLNFIEGLAKVKNEGGNVAAVLDQLGLSEIRVRDSLLRASGASDLFNDSIKKGTKAWEENNALNNEASVRFGTQASQIQMLRNKYELLKEQIGEKLLPIFIKLMEHLGSLMDKFNNLDAGTQDTIIKFGMLMAAAGPVLMVFGGLSQGVGALTSMVSGLSKGLGKVIGGSGLGGLGTVTKGATTATGGLSNAIGGASGATGLLTKAINIGTKAFNPWVLGTVAVVGAGVAIKKGLEQEAIPAVDLFANKVVDTKETIEVNGKKIENATVRQTVTISEATKKAVGAYLELDKGASNALMSLQMNNTTITDKIASDMQNKFNTMGKTITTELEKDFNNDLKATQDFFNNNKTLTDKEMNSIQTTLTENYNKQKAEVENANKRINEILATASAENRKITHYEVDEINRLRGHMKTNAVKALSDQEKESNIILDRLSSYDRHITAETAAEHVKQLNTARDKAVDKANEEYRNTVDIANRMKKEGGVAAEGLANKMIEEAERQKNETINNANKIRNEGIGKLSESYKDLERDVDINTGSIKTNWQKIGDWWDDLWKKPGKKSFTVETNYVEKGRKEQGNGGYMSELWKGTINHSGGLAKVGDVFGREIYQTPSGFVGMANEEQVIDLPRGTRVFTNHETEKILDSVTRNKTFNSILDKANKNTTSKVDYTNDLTNVIEKIVKKVSNQAPTINVYSSGDGNEIARKVSNVIRDFNLGFV